MELSNVLLFVLASIGLSHIVVDGKILLKFREIMHKILPECMYEVFTCYQCSGVWCGLFCGYFLIARDFGVDESWWITATITFMCGCAGSFLSSFGAIYINLLEAKWFATESVRDEQKENGV